MNKNVITDDVARSLVAADANRGSYAAIESGDQRTFANMVSLPDDAVLEGWYDTPIPVAENRVLLGSADELEFAFQAVGKFIEVDIRPSWITSQVLHERQHAIAMNQASVVEVGFGLSISRDAQNEVYLQPFTFGRGSRLPITKLILAGITLYPTTPSAGDSLRSEQMGYQGKNDVATRAIEANVAAGSAVVPVPASLHDSYFGNPVRPILPVLYRS